MASLTCETLNSIPAAHSASAGSERLHVALAYGDPFTPGGVQSQVVGRLNHLGCPNGPVRYTLFTKESVPATSPWPHVPAIQYSGWNRGSLAISEWTASRSLVRRLDEIHRRDPFDLIELHSGGVGPAVVAWAKRAGIPSLYISHSLQCFGPRPAGMRWDAARYYAWSNRRTAAKCSRVVAVSGALQKQWLEHGFSADHIEVQHTATNPSPNLGNEKLRSETFGKRLQVLFVGRISHEKGLDLLIEAIANCAETIDQPPQLNVVGRINPDHPLVQLVQSRQLPVTFLGERSNADVRMLMEQADLLVIPSRYDACPLVAIEALQAGALILATRAGGLPELIDDGKSGLLVPAEDIAALTNSISRVAQNVAAFQPLRDGARTAGKNFEWSVRAPQILDLYRRLVAQTHV